ncbi:MAG: hypothetical protein ACKV2V_03470 [Blastocatellia bacterium]
MVNLLSFALDSSKIIPAHDSGVCHAAPVFRVRGTTRGTRPAGSRTMKTAGAPRRKL